MRKLYILGLIGLTVTIIGLAWAEQITLTTYYPAPYGVYNQMLTNTLGVGDNNGSGTLDSNDVPDPSTNPGDVWIAGNLGIGTAGPGAELDANGDIRAETNTWGTCTWRAVPTNAYQWTCNNGEYVAGIGYELAQWSSTLDSHFLSRSKSALLLQVITGH